MHKTLVAALLVGMLGAARADEAPPVAQNPDAAPPATDEEIPPLVPTYAPVTPALAVAPAPVIDRSEDNEVDETPPLSGGRIVGEVLVGGLFGFGGAVGGIYVGAGLENADGCQGEFCGLGGAIIGGAVGLTLMSSVGVYIVGSTDDQEGSFAATFGGAAAAELLGVALTAGSGGGAWPVMIFGPLVGSMIGFNATRHYVHPRSKRSNIIPVASSANGNTSFGVVGAF